VHASNARIPRRSRAHPSTFDRAGSRCAIDPRVAADADPDAVRARAGECTHR
jgi:hypothetical protein